MPDKSRSPIPLLTLESEAVKRALLTDLRAALPDEHIDLLEHFTNAQLANSDIAIAANPSPAMFKQLPSLIWLQSMWAGVENLIEVARLNNFKLVRLVDTQLAYAMAEAALTFTLYLHRQLPEYAQQQRQQSWQQRSYRAPAECRVTVLGLGELGRACANRLANNGFSVSGWSRTAKSLPGIDCHAGVRALAPLLGNTDILIVLLPLTPETNNLINKRTLAMLPKDACLINFARGPIVDTNDLVDALDKRQLRHAVLDVFDEEPLPQSSPLWQNENVTVLPHIAAPTDPQSAAAIAAANISNYRTSGKLPITVDLERGF